MKRKNENLLRRAYHARAHEALLHLRQWAIRDTEPEQKTRDESSNSSRVFVEKRRVFLPLREVDDGFGFHTGSPSGEYS